MIICIPHLVGDGTRWLFYANSGNPAAICGDRLFFTEMGFGIATMAVSFDWNHRYHKRQDKAVVYIPDEGYVKEPTRIFFTLISNASAKLK